MTPARKNFKIPPEDLQPLAFGYGMCLATDEIVVVGHPVGYMYREEAFFEQDSGWRFFADTETEAYMKNPDHQGTYDVNTLANYDRDIIPHLDSPVGSAFQRDPETNRLMKIEA